MKTFAITVLLVFSLLGAGCSDSDQPTVSSSNTSLTPMPDYTQEEIAAMKAASPGTQGEFQPVTAPTSLPVQVVDTTPVSVTMTTPTPTP